MIFQIMYITKFHHDKVQVKKFVSYLETLKFISNNIDKIESMLITKEV